MSSDLPSPSSLWNVDQPVASLATMQELLHDPRCHGEYRDLLTLKMVHALGYQHKITQAFELLEPFEERLTTLSPRLVASYHLEKGRISNRASYGSKEATEHLERALERSSRDQIDDLAIEALLELADLSDGPESQQELLERAEQLATSSRQPDVRKWLPRVYHELGWFWCEEEDPHRALPYFERALETRKVQQHAPKEIDNARYYVARMWRATGEPQRALDELQSLVASPESSRDGYTLGEIARCLVDLDRSAEATPFVEEAIEALKRDQWVDEDEVNDLTSLL